MIYNNDIGGDCATTGEKLAALRRKKGITQEELSDILMVSRQSVSRWEMDAAFPETDKLIKLSKLFECSIDFLLNDKIQESEKTEANLSIDDSYKFIRECGYFFLATSSDNQPKLRPFGMIYSNGETMFFVTDKRKNVHSDLQKNANVELASYNIYTHKWIRITGKAQVDSSVQLKEEVITMYPKLRYRYHNDEEMYLVIYKMFIDKITIA